MGTHVKPEASYQTTSHHNLHCMMHVSSCSVGVALPSRVVDSCICRYGDGHLCGTEAQIHPEKRHLYTLPFCTSFNTMKLWHFMYNTCEADAKPVIVQSRWLQESFNSSG